jgi:hypothetical protein
MVEWLMIMVLFEDGISEVKKKILPKKVFFQLLLSNLNQKFLSFLFFSFLYIA